MSRTCNYFVKEFLCLREKSAHLPSATMEMLNYLNELPQLCTHVYMEEDELEMTLSNFVLTKYKNMISREKCGHNQTLRAVKRQVSESSCP